MSKIVIPSEFVQPNIDVKDGDVITILECLGWNILPQDKSKQVFHANVKLTNGEEKKISINKTSLKKLMAAWGDEDEKWVNKKVRVEIVKQQAFGELKNVIYLFPTDESISTVEPTEEEQKEADREPEA